MFILETFQNVSKQNMGHFQVSTIPFRDVVAVHSLVYPLSVAARGGPEPAGGGTKPGSSGAAVAHASLRLPLPVGGLGQRQCLTRWAVRRLD